MEKNYRKVLTNKEIKRKARESLKGKWEEIVIFSCIYFLIIKVFYLLFLVVDLGDLLNFIPHDKNFIANQGLSIKLIFIIFNINKFFFSGILIYGLSYLSIYSVRDEYCDNKIVFKKSKKLKIFIKTCFINISIAIRKMIWTIFMLDIIIILGLVVFTPCFIDMLSRGYLYDILQFSILPVDIQEMLVQNSLIVFAILLGIIIIYFIIIVKYNFAFFIAVDGENKNFMKCIKTSKEIISEYRIKLLFLYLSFSGWVLVSIITFGIGFVLLKIYVHTSIAVFYDDIKEININNAKIKEIKIDDNSETITLM
ncbi:DUF975 family protein [Clostridium sp. DL1XJH146]